MSFFKLLFCRFSIVTLLVLLQAAAFVAVLIFLDKLTPFYIGINITLSVAGFFIVLTLINRQTNPNYILPWVIFLLILPMAGALTYMMFSQNRLSRKEKKRYRRVCNLSKDYIEKPCPAKEALKKISQGAYGQSEYLFKAGKLPVYNDSQCKFYPEYDKLFMDMLLELQRAQRFIFLEYFIIRPGVMWSAILDILVSKAASGVEVRVMYDDLGSIGALPAKYPKILANKGIKCVKFHKFLPVISAIHNNRDHRKMTIIDGYTAFMGGGNISDEYINAVQKFGYFKDSGVMLRGNVVNSLTIMFLQNYNAQLKECQEFSSYILNHPPCGSGFLQPFCDGPVPIFNEKVGQNAITNLISFAREYIYITTPYLIIDFQLTEAIKIAAKRGVDVKIFTPHIPDKRLIHLMTRASYKSFIEAGVKILEYTPGFIHSKNILCDGDTAIIGTINLDYRSLVHHFECGVWIFGSEQVLDIKKDFDDIESVSQLITLEESKLNFFEFAVKSVLQIFAPML